MSSPRLSIVVFALLLALPGTGMAGVRIAPRDEPLQTGRELAAGVRVLPARTAPFRFNLVGLHWRGNGDVWFRTRARSGGWGTWRPARPEGEDLPDPGSRERRAQHGWTIGNPWWTGPSRAIQFRVSGNVSRLRAYYVWSGTRASRRLTIAGTPGIISRASWAASESMVRARPYYAARVQFAVVHHTAGRQPSSPEESAAIVRAIQAYHVKGNGWNDIGYNFLVDPFGQVFEGRGGGVERAVIGAHAEGFNTGSVGIAVIGTYGSHGISEDAKAAIEELIAWRLDLAHVDPVSLVTHISAGNPRFRSGVPVTLRAVSGHRDTGFTSCPGNALYGQLAEIARTAEAIGVPKIYEPRVSGGIGGQVRFTARLSEPLPWTIAVTDGSGNAVANGSGVGSDIAWTWDATAAAPGSYAYRIDAGPAALPAIGTIGGAVALDVSELKAEPSALTPDQDGNAGETQITFTLSAPATATLTLVDAAGATVATLVPQRSLPAGPATISWNGALPDGTPVPDGRYRIALLVEGKKRQISKSTEVVVDRTLVGLGLSSTAISPDGNGRLDALSLGFDLARPAMVRVRILAGTRSVARVFLGELGVGRQSLVWNGRKRTGRMRDGHYVAVVEATTELGTRSLGLPFTIDTTPPRVSELSAQVRRSAVKLRFRLSEGAKLKVWLDGNAFTIDRPAGAVAFWQRIAPRRVRLVAWDAAGNRAEPVVMRVGTRRS